MKQSDIQQMIQLFRKFAQSSQEQARPIEPQNQLRISNKESKYTLDFGEKYKDLLEPRDHVLEHEFDFVFPTSSDSRLKLESNQLPDCVMKKIKQFLVQSSNNVVSAAFNFLCEDKLQEDQAKEYASKNILLNINSIFRETVTKIRTSSFYLSIKSDIQKKKQQMETKLKELFRQRKAKDTFQFLKILKLKGQTQVLCPNQEKISVSDIELIWSFSEEKLVQNLTIHFDNMLSQILKNLAGNYPQAPPAGGTPRMRAEIMDVNRQQDEENDLIYANKIKIIDFLKMEGNGIRFEDNYDYTEFIMTVLNKAISVVQTNQEDYKERTVAEKFKQFNEKLFTLVQLKSYHSLLGSLHTKQNISSENQNKVAQEKKIVQYFFQILKNSQAQSTENVIQSKDVIQNQHDQVEQITERKDNESRQNEKDQQIKHSESNLLMSRQSSQSLKNNQGNSMNLIFNQMKIQLEKEGNIFKGGSKIPMFVKQFTRWEVKNKDFFSKHSSILRILTKWAEYLAQIFDDPEKQIFGRTYSFKTIENNIFKQLQSYNGKGNDRSILVKNLKKQAENVKKKYQTIVKNCYRLIGELLRKQKSTSSSVKRYSDTRSVASKIRAILTQQMLIYTNTLIHHLLKAGSLNNNQSVLKSRYINLVVFRISDLLRTKLQCNESSFISLLRTLYLLDADESMKGKFKLVRIKNKLDMPDNNIMINYLFMGKVQCQLQLSIQQPQKKAKNYYTFSHFVYELTRGKFGTIAQLAIMISQLDNMISTCQAEYYVECLGKPIVCVQGGLKEDQLDTLSEANNSQSYNLHKNLYKSIFQCSSCKRMVIDRSQDLFERKKENKLCNNCSFDLKLPMFNKQIENFCNHQNVKKIESYKEIKLTNQQQAYQCLVCLRPQKKLEFYIAFRVQQQFKVFLLRLNRQFFKQLEEKSIDYSKVDYFDIKKKINKNYNLKQNRKQIIFLIKNFYGFDKNIYELMDLDQETLKQNILKAIEDFKVFRYQKNLAKSVKFKAEILQLNSHQLVWDTLKGITQRQFHLSSSNNQKKSVLKYKKHFNLDFSLIKTMKLCNQPQTKTVQLNFQRFENLQKLEIIGNKINLMNLTNFKNLKQILARHNQFHQISIKNLPKITHMDLSLNKIDEININSAPQLICLTLKRNQLTKLVITNCYELIELNLDDNKLKQVPLNNFCAIQKLSLTFNCLEQIQLNNLEKLTVLQLWNNKLQGIDLSKNLHLKEINLSNNLIKQIQLNHLKKLEKVNLTNNKLKKIIVNNLQQLKHLYVSQNQLLNIAYFNDLQLLEELNVSQNHNLIDFRLENTNNLQILLMHDTNIIDNNISLSPKLRYVSMNKKLSTKFNFLYLQNLKTLQIYFKKYQEKIMNSKTNPGKIRVIMSEIKQFNKDSQGYQQNRQIITLQYLLQQFLVFTFKNFYKIMQILEKNKRNDMSGRKKTIHLLLDQIKIGKTSQLKYYKYLEARELTAQQFLLKKEDLKNISKQNSSQFDNFYDWKKLIIKQLHKQEKQMKDKSEKKSFKNLRDKQKQFLIQIESNLKLTHMEKIYEDFKLKKLFIQQLIIQLDKWNDLRSENFRNKIQFKKIFRWFVKKMKSNDQKRFSSKIFNISKHQQDQIEVLKIQFRDRFIDQYLLTEKMKNLKRKHSNQLQKRQKLEELIKDYLNIQLNYCLETVHSDDTFHPDHFLQQFVIQEKKYQEAQIRQYEIQDFNLRGKLVQTFQLEEIEKNNIDKKDLQARTILIKQFISQQQNLLKIQREKDSLTDFEIKEKIIRDIIRKKKKKMNIMNNYNSHEDQDKDDDYDYDYRDYKIQINSKIFKQQYIDQKDKVEILLQFIFSLKKQLQLQDQQISYQRILRFSLREQCDISQEKKKEEEEEEEEEDLYFLGGLFS